MPKRPNSRGSRRSFDNGQCLSQPSGSHPKSSREPRNANSCFGRPSRSAGAGRCLVGHWPLFGRADRHLVGYQSSSRRGAPPRADRHFIGYHSSSRKGASSGVDHHFIGCHCSSSRTGMFYQRVICIFFSLCCFNLISSFRV
jgi:hypothetical protein